MAVNDEKKTLTIKLQPAKSRLVVKQVQDEKKMREVIEATIRESVGHVECKIEMDKHSNMLVNMGSEQEAEQLLAAVEKHPEVKANCVLEEREPYQEFKDSIERIKKQKKDKNQMFNPFDNANNYYQGQQPQQQWQGVPNMPNTNVPAMPTAMPTMPNMQNFGYNCNLFYNKVGGFNAFGKP